MGNPLYNLMTGGNQAPQLPGALGNMANMMKQFNQFKQTFQGDPRQQVQELLNSGKMSQNQFNQLKGLADQFQQMMR